MSLDATRAVYGHSRARDKAFTLLLALADESDPRGRVDGRARRSYSWLAAKGRIHKSSITRLVHELVDLGEIVVLRQGNGRVRAEYQIVLPGLGTDGPEEVARSHDAHREVSSGALHHPIHQPVRADDEDDEGAHGALPREDEWPDGGNLVTATDPCLAAIVEDHRERWHTRSDPANPRRRWRSRAKILRSLADACNRHRLSPAELRSLLATTDALPYDEGLDRAIKRESSPTGQPAGPSAAVPDIPFEVDEWRQVTDEPMVVLAVQQALDSESDEAWRRRLLLAQGEQQQMQVLQMWHVGRGECLR